MSDSWYANDPVAGQHQDEGQWWASDPPTGQQNGPVSRAAASAPPHPPKPEPEKKGGIARNAIAGANKLAYEAATGFGIPDLVAHGINLGVRGINAVAGTHIPEATPASTLLGRAAGTINPDFNPENTVANTPGERVARAAGYGAGAVILPEMAGRAVYELAPELGNTILRYVGKSDTLPDVARNVVVGSTAGAGSQGAQEAVPEPYKPIAGLAGGLVGGAVGLGAAAIPNVAIAGGRAVRDFAMPLTAKGQEQLAADRIQAAATDKSGALDTLRNAPQELVPGSQPTTFQVTGDMGLGGLERQSQTQFKEPFIQRAADQNAARVAAVQNVQKAGAPEQVAQSVRSHLNDLQTLADQDVSAATQTAQRASNGIGLGVVPEQAGNALRTSLQTAKNEAEKQTSALWQAVDPDKTLALAPQSTVAKAQQIASSMPAAAKPMSGEEKGIFDVVGQMGQYVPLTELDALRKRVGDAMRTEFEAGNGQAYNRLKQLNGAIHDDLAGAVAGRVAQDEAAVAAGQIAPENSLAANIQRQIDEWRSARGTAGGDIAASLGSAGAARAPAVRAGYGNQSAPGIGLPNAASNPRLSADAANFDQAALDRLTAAREATKQTKGTFENGTLGPILERPGPSYPYNAPDATVAQRVFVPGPKGFETIQTYRNAVSDPEAMNTLQGYAVDRLRASAMRPDGTLDPAKVTAFRKQYGDALRAFPELDAKFADAAKASDALAEVAAQRKTMLDNAQKGVVGRLMGLDAPEDVTRAVGGIFSRQDAVQQMTQLRQALASNPAGQDGLKKSIADYIAKRFIGNTEAATSGVGTIKSDSFQTFVKQNKAALKAAGFSDEQIGAMKAVADDLQRANRSNTSTAIQGRSTTAQDQRSILGHISDAAASKVGGFMEGAALGSHFGPFGMFLGGIGGAALNSMRQAGFNKVDEIIADAMLNPERARILLERPATKSGQQAAWQKLGQAYRNAAAISSAQSVDQHKPLRVEITKYVDPHTGQAVSGDNLKHYYDTHTGRVISVPAGSTSLPVGIGLH